MSEVATAPEATESAAPETETTETKAPEAKEPKAAKAKPKEAPLPKVEFAENGRLTDESRELAAKAVREAMKEPREKARKEKESEEESETPAVASKPAQDASKAKEAPDTAKAAEDASEADAEALAAKPKETFQERLDRLVKEREKAKEIRRDAEEERHAARREAEELRAQTKAMREEMEAWKENMKLLNSDPMTAFQRLGIDPERHLTRIAESDPESRKRQEYEDTLQRRLDEAERWRKEVEQSVRAHQEEIATKQEETRQRSIVDSYLKASNDSERFPNLTARYGDDPEYKVQLGHKAADHLRGLLGYQPSQDDILEYIEDQLSRKGSRAGVGNHRSAEGETTRLPKTVGRAEMNAGKGSGDSVPQDWEERRRLARKLVSQAVKDSERDD